MFCNRTRVKDSNLLLVYSKELTNAPSYYQTHKWELLAIIVSTKEWKLYFDRKHNGIVADHCPLTHLHTQSHLSHRKWGRGSIYPHKSLSLYTALALKLWFLPHLSSCILSLWSPHGSNMLLWPIMIPQHPTCPPWYLVLIPMMPHSAYLGEGSTWFYAVYRIYTRLWFV